MNERTGEAKARTRVAVTMALKVLLLLLLTLLCMSDASNWLDDRRLLTRARFGRGKQMASGRVD